MKRTLPIEDIMVGMNTMKPEMVKELEIPTPQNTLWVSKVQHRRANAKILAGYAARKFPGYLDGQLKVKVHKIGMQFVGILYVGKRSRRMIEKSQNGKEDISD